MTAAQPDERVDQAEQNFKDLKRSWTYQSLSCKYEITAFQSGATMTFGSK